MKNKKVQGCNKKSYRCTLKLYQAKKKKYANKNSNNNKRLEAIKLKDTWNLKGY
jgi:hypothetical protein